MNWFAKTIISAELLHKIISREGIVYCSELLRSAGINAFSPGALKSKQVISVEENGV